MYFDPILTKLVVKERLEDAVRREEKARLLQEVEGSGKSGRWRQPITLMLKSLLAFVVRSPR